MSEKALMEYLAERELVSKRAGGWKLLKVMMTRKKRSDAMLGDFLNTLHKDIDDMERMRMIQDSLNEILHVAKLEIIEAAESHISKLRVFDLGR